MENKISYQYFERCCHDYLNNKERLLSMSKSMKIEDSRVFFVKSSELDYVAQNILLEQVDLVERMFEKLKEKDPILSKIMYLNLVEKKTFDEIGKQRLVEVSRRTASRKYAKKYWEEIFNETILD